jgi:hypothetical protein
MVLSPKPQAFDEARFAHAREFGIAPFAATITRMRSIASSRLRQAHQD